MNIFVFSFVHAVNASLYCDQHVIKIILEITQVLYTAIHVLNYDLIESAPNEGYRKTHVNHPTCIWARTSRKNWLWTLKMGLALCDEFNYRGFKQGRDHASKEHLLWMVEIQDKICFPNEGYTVFYQAMPDQYRIKGDTVGAYKRYVKAEKSVFRNAEPRWTRRTRPEWW